MFGSSETEPPELRGQAASNLQRDRLVYIRPFKQVSCSPVEFILFDGSLWGEGAKSPVACRLGVLPLVEMPSSPASRYLAACGWYCTLLEAQPLPAEENVRLQGLRGINAAMGLLCMYRSFVISFSPVAKPLSDSASRSFQAKRDMG
jgi:hypothetical protein